MVPVPHPILCWGFLHPFFEYFQTICPYQEQQDNDGVCYKPIPPSFSCPFGFSLVPKIGCVKESEAPSELFCPPSFFVKDSTCHRQFKVPFSLECSEGRFLVDDKCVSIVTEAASVECSSSPKVDGQCVELITGSNSLECPVAFKLVNHRCEQLEFAEKEYSCSKHLEDPADGDDMHPTKKCSYSVQAPCKTSPPRHLSSEDDKSLAALEKLMSDPYAMGGHSLFTEFAPPGHSSYEQDVQDAAVSDKRSSHGDSQFEKNVERPSDASPDNSAYEQDVEDAVSDKRGHGDYLFDQEVESVDFPKHGHELDQETFYDAHELQDHEQVHNTSLHSSVNQIVSHPKVCTEIYEKPAFGRCPRGFVSIDGHADKKLLTIPGIESHNRPCYRTNVIAPQIVCEDTILDGQCKQVVQVPANLVCSENYKLVGNECVKEKKDSPRQTCPPYSEKVFKDKALVECVVKKTIEPRTTCPAGYQRKKEACVQLIIVPPSLCPKFAEERHGGCFVKVHPTLVCPEAFEPSKTDEAVCTSTHVLPPICNEYPRIFHKQ
eukprot:GHVT01020223.1.p1 GENE.GHVT01020223.1~~GHVT01020223.1.p1  ORF type:complete len:546 (+),score=50.96 GHVT01020223.1:470-2107(+)